MSATWDSSLWSALTSYGGFPLTRYWQGGLVCHTCCMLFLWLGMDSLYGAMTVHTGDTELTIFAVNDFETV